MALTPFRIHAEPTPNEKNLVEVDGRNITGQISTFQVIAGVGRTTELTVWHTPGAGDITGEGIVTVVADGRDPAEAVRALDLAEVSRRILNLDSSIADDPIAVQAQVMAEMLDEQAADDG